MSPPFTPTTALEQHLCRGDSAAALTLLASMPEDERLALQPRLRRLATLVAKAWESRYDKLARSTPTHPTLQPWGAPVSREHVDAVGAADWACGGFDSPLQIYLFGDTLVQLALRFRPPGLRGVGPRLLPHRLQALQQLQAAGLVDRPSGVDHDAYVLALMELPLPHRRRRGTRTVELDELLAEDPGLPAQLLHLFDVEGTAEVSLSGVEKYGKRGDGDWVDWLLGLSQRGVFTRATLLDRTLAALERDWPQFRAGWFSRFHDRLDPTVDEMAPQAARYLSLCHSRIPPTAALALRALKPLLAAKAVAPAELLTALTPVLSAGVKAQVLAAMKLLDAAVAAQPELAAQAAAVACGALMHEAAELQAAALDRLQRWGVDDAARATMRAHAGGIAAVHRPRFEALAGTPPPTAPTLQAAVEPPVPARRPEPLDEDRRLSPPADLADLVQRTAHALEHDDDPDTLDQVLDGLVRLAPLPSDARRALAPVFKRARKVRTPLARELSRLLIWLQDGSAPSVREVHGALPSRPSALWRFGERIDDLIALAAESRGFGALSTPTHRGGFIDPTALRQRWQAFAAAGLRPPTRERQLAWLRLPPGSDLDGWQRRLGLGATGAGPGTPFSWRLTWQTHPLPDDKIQRIYTFHVDGERAGRGADPDDWCSARLEPIGWEGLYGRPWAVGGDSVAEVRWMATLTPGSLQAFFAEGARLVGQGLQWSEVAWQLRAYLEPLLDPAVPLGAMGMLLLGLGLGEREPGRAAIAVDALVGSAADGRLDVAALGEELARLTWAGVMPSARLQKGLAAAAARSASARHSVLQLLQAVCGVAGSGPAPRGYGGLLELLLELSLDLQQPLPAATAAALAALEIGGKGAAARARLVALSAGHKAP
jgi:hypothetical protein